MDEAVSQHLLGQTLSTVLSQWFSAGDESVWLIRRLELDVSVNASWEREQLTRTIAAQLAQALSVTLEQGEEGHNVLRFANHAAYLAHFISDLAAGRAWSRWYYESFSGLRLLSTSAALRSAICDQPETGLSALLELADYDLKQVLRTLSSQDARRILESIAGDTTEGSVFNCCQAAWAAWRMIETDSFSSANQWSQALHLYLVASRGQSEVGGVALTKSAVALVQLARLLATRSAEQAQQILSALTDGDLSLLHQNVGGADALALAPLLDCPPVWVREVVETLLAGQTAGAAGDTAYRTGRRDISFGGIFLLLPLVDELPLAEATSGWPHADEAAAISLVRFLLLVKCCGHERAERAFYDPVLRDLLLIPPGISPSVIREWSARVTAAQVESFLNALIDWQTSQGAIQNKQQILRCVNWRGAQVAILIDGARGHWLTVQMYSQRRLPRLVKALKKNLFRLERDDGILLSDPSLLENFWSEFAALRMLSLEDELAQGETCEENQMAGILARLGRLPADLSHLAVPDSLRLARRLDRALSVAAQHLYRAFSWRLPGFAESSLPYLASNFLNFSGSVEDEPERRVIRLGRPPLHLVLGLTGMARQIYRLSWLDERPLALFPEN